MNKQRRFFARRLQLTAALLSLCPCFARAQAVAVVTKGPEFASTAGVPFGGVIQGADGNFYGTTTVYTPGATTLMPGALFKLTRAGVMTVLHQFVSSAESSAVFPLLQLANGDFYGTSQSNSGGNGEVFKYSSSGVFSVVHSFSGADGSEPAGALIVANDGNLYGATNSGGMNDQGTIYQITTTGGFTKLHDFADAEGSGPTGALLQANDGFLYGTTGSGGDQNVGTLFRTSIGGKFNVAFSFDGTMIAGPGGSLIQASDGYLYGLSGDMFSGVPATIYKFLVGAAGIPSVVHSFIRAEGVVGSEYGGSSLLQAIDGNLYGATAISVEESDDDGGTLFQCKLSGDFAIIYRFESRAGALSSLVQAKDGLLYGSGYAQATTVLGPPSTLPVFIYSASISPVVTSVSSAPAAPGKPFNFEVLATNSPTSYSANGLPPGLAFNNATGVISGVISATPGSYPVTLGAANANGVSSSILSIVVENAPAVTSALSATAQEGQPFTYQITATNSPTILSAGGLPAGLSVDATGLISGIPTASGSYTVNLFASNVAGPGGALLNLNVEPGVTTINLTASMPQTVAGSGQPAEFVFTRTGGDNSALLKVAYKIKGSARDGIDYIALSGTKKLKPGKGSATIEIVPIGNAGGPGQRVVTLKLVGGDGYQLGASVKAKVTIVGR